MPKRDKSGQTIFQYALLITLVILALTAMSRLMQMAIQSRYRHAADSFGQGEQYQPGKTIETKN